MAGGCWIDGGPAAAAARGSRARCRRRPRSSAGASPQAAQEGLGLVASPRAARPATTPVSPLLSKLYQESDLRPAATVAAMRPEHGRAARPSRPAARADREPGRPVRAELRIDATLPPGRIALAAGPDPGALHPGTSGKACGALPLAVAEADGTWRGTRVRVEEA